MLLVALSADSRTDLPAHSDSRTDLPAHSVHLQLLCMGPMLSNMREGHTVAECLLPVRDGDRRPRRPSLQLSLQWIETHAAELTGWPQPLTTQSRSTALVSFKL